MSATERTQRRRARLREDAARETEIARKYFALRHPLSPQERAEFARELGLLPENYLSIRRFTLRSRVASGEPFGNFLKLSNQCQRRDQHKPRDWHRNGPSKILLPDLAVRESRSHSRSESSDHSFVCRDSAMHSPTPRRQHLCSSQHA